MPPPKYLAQANRLLAALPAESRALFLEHCELVDLNRQDVLTLAGQTTDYAYFPIDSFIASILKLEDASDVQFGLTGNEGMVNVSLVLGISVTSTTSVVQGAGRAYRISQHELQEQLKSTPGLRDVLHNYVALRMDQLAQNMACASCHSVEQRLARWLLMAQDRAHSSELLLTHEVLAFMLGVRRESVTQAASSLQKQALISYSRGDIMLLDEPGLKAVACECYQTNLTIYEHAMGCYVTDQSL